MKKIFIILFYFISFLCSAQDIHFSQFFNTPLLLNPAMTGEFSGNARMSIHYKNQWSSITNHPYNTIAVIADKNFFSNKIASGISIFSDRAGITGMSNSQINWIIAPIVRLNDNQLLRFALQAGWSQRTINVNQATWDNQFDGHTFNKELYNGESKIQNNFSYFNMASGMLWSHRSEKKIFHFGISAFNITRPRYTYLNDQTVRLDTRWCWHGDAELLFNKISFIPSLGFWKQGSLEEINIGALLKYNMVSDTAQKDLKLTNIYSGLFMRNHDAMIIYFRIDYQNIFALGLSYDINTSKLHSISDMRGGLEISLFYLMPNRFKPEPIACPKY